VTAAEAALKRAEYELRRRTWSAQWREAERKMEAETMPAKQGRFSCLDRAMDGEPVFELLARDPSFGRLVRAWADEREAAINAGDRPREDMEQVSEARLMAAEGEQWRRDHLYEWRKVKPEAAA
jgi:hypothetical protein